MMQPLGYGFGASTHIKVPSGNRFVVAVEKKRITGPVTRSAIHYLDQLRPHISHSAMMSSRLQFERINAAVEALQLTGLPSAILAADGKVMAANELLETFGPQVSIVSFDRVRFARENANRLLAESLANIKTNARSIPIASQSFPLNALDPHPPAVVHLVPIRGSARDIFTHAAAFLIVTPVDRSRVPSAETIQGLFDLTPAEARVARLLATGNNVGAAAQELRVSVDTVRSQVKSILSKSGMPRQGEFIAAVTNIRPIE